MKNVVKRVDGLKLRFDTSCEPAEFACAPVVLRDAETGEAVLRVLKTACRLRAWKVVYVGSSWCSQLDKPTERGAYIALARAVRKAGLPKPIRTAAFAALRVKLNGNALSAPSK